MSVRSTASWLIPASLRGPHRADHGATGREHGRSCCDPRSTAGSHRRPGARRRLHRGRSLRRVAAGRDRGLAAAQHRRRRRPDRRGRAPGPDHRARRRGDHPARGAARLRDRAVPGRRRWPLVPAVRALPPAAGVAGLVGLAAAGARGAAGTVGRRRPAADPGGTAGRRCLRSQRSAPGDHVRRERGGGSAAVVHHVRPRSRPAGSAGAGRDGGHGRPARGADHGGRAGPARGPVAVAVRAPVRRAGRSVPDALPGTAADATGRAAARPHPTHGRRDRPDGRLRRSALLLVAVPGVRGDAADDVPASGGPDRA